MLWKLLAGVVLGLGLFLWPGLIPSLVLGYDNNQQQLYSWYKEMVYPFVIEGKVTPEHNNQSLPGLIARLMTHSPAFSTYDKAGTYVPLEYHNFITLSPESARWLVKGALGLFALVIVCCCRTRTEPRQGWRLSAEFSIILLGMLLFSERTWKHHCVTLLLPFAVLSYLLMTQPWSFARRGWLIASLAVSLSLMFLSDTGFGSKDAAAPHALGKMVQLYGSYVAIYAILLAGLAAMLLTTKDQRAEMDLPQVEKRAA